MPTLHHTAPVLAAVLALLLGSCAHEGVRTPPAAPAMREAAPDLDREYAQLAHAGERVLMLDQPASVIVVEVRRAGTLASLGHDHVVASHAVHGFVAPGLGRAAFEFALVELVVDEPDLRAAAAMQTRPSPEAVAGTRENMLTRVLHVQQHPRVVVRVARHPGSGKDGHLRATVTLNGITRDLDVTASVDEVAAGMHIAGHASILQTQFGLTPLAILGGAISVADELVVRFDVRARPWQPVQRS